MNVWLKAALVDGQKEAVRPKTGQVAAETLSNGAAGLIESRS